MHRVLKTFYLIIILISSFYIELYSNKTYTVPEVTGKIKADGLMNESIWNKALKLELNFEVEPGENIKPPVKTEVFIAYSKTDLYIAFKAYDPRPEEILARISDRDNIGNEDWVAVILDTFNDQRRSFDFMCNAYGVQSDFIEVSSGDGGSWDTIWDSGGKITDFGYVVEMSIPFSSIRFQRKNGAQTWGFDAVRSYPRNLRHHIGTFPRDRSNNCYLCQSIRLKGFEGVKQGKNIELNPTLSGHYTQVRENENEDTFSNSKKIDPGITAKWGFTNNLTLSATLNPDFSQVEADAMQFNINEPFALYFQEKRPFFTEGSDFFSTRMNAVYTRTMQDPHWGIKITGKEGTHTIGGYIVRDNVTNLLFPGSEGSNSTSLNMDSTASVLRYKKDFGSKYTVGLLFTNRQGTEYSNNVYGIDGNLLFTPKDRFRFQVLGSNIKYPGSVSDDFSQSKDRFSDTAMDFQYIHDERNFLIYGGYKRIGENFRADLGFMPKVGYRSYYGGIDYSWYAKPGKWWTKFILENDFSKLEDIHGNLLDKNYSVKFHYMGPKQIYSNIGYEAGERSYNGHIFKINQFRSYFEMNPTGNIYTSIDLKYGDQIDYANTRLGKRFRINLGINYNIGQHIKLVVRNMFENMTINSQKLYNANITEFRTVYQFNKKTFIRGILQYVNYKYTVGLYENQIDPLDKNLFTQFLFSYKINPRTVLFLGYSDNYFNYINKGLLQMNRTFFLKIGYALTI